MAYRRHNAIEWDKKTWDKAVEVLLLHCSQGAHVPGSSAEGPVTLLCAERLHRTWSTSMTRLQARTRSTSTNCETS